MKSVRWKLFFVALLVGCLVNYLGDWVLGIRIELFYGLQTFNFIWFLQLFVWPVVVGLSVSCVYGLGGKWISMFPPLIVRAIAYYETQNFLGVPGGAELMPLGWWAFFVILAMEAAMFGGVFGEVAIKRIYGRSDPANAGLSSEADSGAEKPDATRID